ncbi:uncharacterized protein LOC116429898 isoform X1 [Nomia melanderi]|uniref:uncharacterized protein LOC116429898 isoform X1 n=1 Tax=Nomia melanderi TaxID=2448451 RepID=UPI001304324E|nr:uncharacterized protein LOC116429898 isoform X1 [Nomia melanderi]
MSNANGRRVRSLNDIPDVFRNSNRRKYNAEPRILQVSLENLLELIEEFYRNKRNIADFLIRGKEDTDRGTPRIEIRPKAEDSTIDPAADSSLVERFIEDESSKNRREFVGRKRFKENKRVLCIIDAILSMLLISPMAIGFWRGIWTLMDIYGEWFPGVPTFLLGTLIHAVFAIFKNFLHTHLYTASRKKNCVRRASFKCLQIFYTYVFGVACNAQWRGGWIIFDRYFGGHVWITTGVLLMVLTGLAVLRSVRNVIAVPSVIFVDKLAFVFYFPTRYKSNTRDWSLYLLDCAFSVGVVGTLVVFVWRGVWILVDLYLFPDDRKYSAIGSLAIGYVIVTVTFSLQPLMRYVCARLQGLARLVAADGFLLLSFLGTVNVWRGIWNLLDLWLVPSNLELSCWITHVGCFVFLVLLNCSNSILVRGVYIDAEEDDGKCVVFPCHYLRLFFKVEREKKEARRRNLLVASKDFRPRSDGNAKDTENGALLPNSAPATILPTSPESLV